MSYDEDHLSYKFTALPAPFYDPLLGISGAVSALDEERQPATRVLYVPITRGHITKKTYGRET